MILQALNNCYQRFKDDPSIDIPLTGFGREKIHFCLVINREGEIVQIKDLREMSGKKTVPVELTVPVLGKKKSSGIESKFLWDNTGYVLGADNKGKDDRTMECFKTFKKLHHEIGDYVYDDGMEALLKFLNAWEPEKAQSLQHWDEMSGTNIVFQLDGERRYLHDRPAVQIAWSQFVQGEKSGLISTCLVSGDKAPIALLHPPVKGVKDAHTAGAGIASYNIKASESYGKTQNYNAPVSKAIAFSYTTILNHLLRFGSRQKVQIADATTIFWTERDSPIEGFMGVILNPQDDSGELSEIQKFLEAVRDGKMYPEIGDPDIQFYILGLSPNVSRLSVRFWHISTVGDMAEKIGQHFRDLSIIRRFEKDPEFPGMWHILRQTALQGKTDNIPPLLAGAVMRSILTGEPYPQTLLSGVIGRIRADHDINYLRTAIIKACLVRKFRINHIEKEVKMALDKDSKNTAYRLGRLFATLEKAQQDAIPGANTTIKDRYYGSASATPRSVFPQLLRMAQHHIQKAEYGRRTDKMIEEIVSEIKEFPAHLSLDDQGMFAIGYYHQRQAFYTKSENQKEGE
ncbi:MAG: type I-C CRISPR-associated protein Cas8c/Csd1 [Syntrophus sp. (in: bacteria)]|nr:type I-C CRISPR-associated protein Cas8c/Csd1 [Syntrophus sp. (in: bacteria)]